MRTIRGDGWLGQCDVSRAAAKMKTMSGAMNIAAVFCHYIRQVRRFIANIAQDALTVTLSYRNQGRGAAVLVPAGITHDTVVCPAAPVRRAQAGGKAALLWLEREH